MNVIEVNAEPREQLGAKPAKQLRSEGKIPAVMYSKNGVFHFTTTKKDVKPLVYSADLNLAQIILADEPHRAILKEVDFHPVTDDIQHIDFIELVEGQPVKVSIPIKFKGVSPGVRNGGKLIRNLRVLKVKTMPEHLVDELFLDISNLKLGGVVRVKDIEIPEGIEVLVNENIPVANVIVPRALKDIDEEMEGEEEEGEGEEGESSEEGSGE